MINKFIFCISSLFIVTLLGMEAELVKSENESNIQNQQAIKAIVLTFICKNCEFVADSEDLLAAHANLHSVGRFYQCEHCDYGTATKRTLDIHIRSHTGERPFKCGNCDYAAVDRSNLSRHMLIHTGELPFKCEQCNYASNQRYNLKGHVIRIHKKGKEQ